MLAIVLVTAGCSDNSIPGDVIPPEKMKMIVYDLLRADEAAIRVKLDSSINTYTNRTLVMYNNVFAVHKISRDEFYKSYKYYEEHPDLNKALMDSVSTFANREKMNQYNRPPIKTDSLRKKVHLPK